MIKFLVIILLVAQYAIAGPIINADPALFMEAQYKPDKSMEMKMCCQCCPYGSEFSPLKPKPLCIPMSGVDCNQMGWACFGYMPCPRN